MLSNEQIESLRPRITQFRIVLAALIGGVAVLGLVVMAMGGMNFRNNLSMLSMIFFGISVVVVLQAFVVPGIVRAGVAGSSIKQGVPSADSESNKGPSDDSASRLLGTWFTSTLISAAMLESAAFINLAGAFVEKNTWHMVAAGVILILMVTRFPTEDRVIGWIEDQIRDRQRGA